MSVRVVITGLGAVTPAGVGVKAFWQALRDGVSGIDAITRFDATPYACRVAGEVRDFEAAQFMSPKGAATMARFAQLGVAAARMAHEDAGLAAVSTSTRFPVCFGSSTTAVYELQGTIQQFAREGLVGLSPAAVLESIPSSVTNRTALELGLAGPPMTLSSGCASGLDVVGWGVEQIRRRAVAGALVGCSDSPLCTSIFATWSALGLLSTWAGPPREALRPFDAMGNGTVLGEAGAALVLEELGHARARGARVYAEVLGYGSSSEGAHQRTADPTTVSMEASLRAALRAARLGPGDIDYVNTHGGGVPANDRAETAACRAALGRFADNIPVSSIKPVTGNPFAAGGALQIVAGCFALAEQFVPPTLNHDLPASGCDLDYVPNRGRPARVNRLLVAARAIGASYSTVVLGPPPDSLA